MWGPATEIGGLGFVAAVATLLMVVVLLLVGVERREVGRWLRQHQEADWLGLSSMPLDQDHVHL